MKAKVIKTGEIVDVYYEPQHGQVSNIYKESVFVNGRMWQENELEFIESKEVDLEKEIDSIWNPRFNLGWDEKSLLSINHEGFTSIAKHFFELGLKAQKGK